MSLTSLERQVPELVRIVTRGEIKEEILDTITVQYYGATLRCAVVYNRVQYRNVYNVSSLISRHVPTPHDRSARDVGPPRARRAGAGAAGGSPR